MFKRSALLASVVVVAVLASPGVEAQNAGAPLTAAQLRKVLIGRPWNASWGPFSSRIAFQTDGLFNDGLNAPRRWHFSGRQICIAAGSASRENCLDFYAGGGQLTSYVQLGSGPALSYHGALP